VHSFGVEIHRENNKHTEVTKSLESQRIGCQLNDIQEQTVNKNLYTFRLTS